MNLYEELLQKGKQAISDLERPFKVRKEKKSLEMKILEMEQQIAEDELSLQEEKSKSPLNWEKMIQSLDKLEINNRKLTQLLSFELELFGNRKD